MIDRAAQLAAELRFAEARYKRALRRAEELREIRSALIHEALNAGWTHAAIADATGLTRGRVGQYAQQLKRSRTDG